MEVTLTEDQEFFRDTTRRFLATECDVAEIRRLALTGNGFDAGYWRQGAELGWTSLLVPETHGGGSISGNGVIDLSIVADAFGRHVAPGPLGPTNIVAGALGRCPVEHHQQVLGQLLTGEVVAAWCGSEHAMGGGAIAATGDGERWTLSGHASAVEAAGQADLLLVTASADDELIQCLVPARTDGVTITPLHALDVVRRFAEVTFDAVTVSSDARLVTDGPVRTDVERQLQYALVMQSAEMVGAAERTFEFTVEWAFDRYSFGRPLASYQELKHRFADMKTWLEASHGLAAALAREVQSGTSQAAETASATKAYLGRYLAELMQDCVQIHGGIGLTTDHDLHLYLRRVISDRAQFGTPGAHRQRLAALAAADAMTGGAAA